MLVLHRDADTRDRFARALSDGSYAIVRADSEAAAMGHARAGVHGALVDLALLSDAAAFLREVRRSSGAATPVLVFASSVPGADQVPALAAWGVSVFVNDHTAAPQILPALSPHLFPDNFNRRASPRVALGVPVSYRAGQAIAGAVTLDVGKGGLAVRTMTPLPAGTVVHLKFRLPGTGADLEAGGRVAWSDRKVGMGVEFEDIDAGTRATVEAFVDAHQPGN